MDYKEILRNKVLEKGIVDIILDYKRRMEMKELEDMREEIGKMYKETGFYKYNEYKLEWLRDELFKNSELKREDIKKYNKILDKEQEYQHYSYKLFIN